MSWFDETLYAEWRDQGYAQRFWITELIYQEKSEHQDLVIFDTPMFGRVLALDGIIQTTEKDEFIYHEMIAHVPVFGHGAAKRVLIIGGGDGGVLREVLRHKSVELARMVEIDRSVVDLCREYMPSLSTGAFDDPRCDLVIADGCKYAAETDDRFDVIIIDSTDPLGPGEVLFTEQFYADCRRCMTEGGVLVTQNGVPFTQPEEVTNSAKRLGAVFKDVSFYATVVPTYIGGTMMLGWASDNPDLKSVSAEELQRRFEASGLQTRYYSPDMHKAAFSLPPYVRELMNA